MFPEPEYAQHIIVAVIVHNTFAWYITDKEYWYLDYTKYDRAFLAAGLKDAMLGDYSNRCDIAVLNEETADAFLAHCAERRVPASALSHMLLARRKADTKDDLLDFAPSLLVNFDQRQLYSHYPEMIRFENYVTEGWVGAYRDFKSAIPPYERYWMVHGQTVFEKE